MMHRADTSKVRRSRGVHDSEGPGRQSFVLRVWLEEPSVAGRRSPWRGRIIHVPSSNECHSGDLRRIAAFMTAHLDRMGAKLSIRERLALWFDGSRLFGRPASRLHAEPVVEAIER